ncbi:MAG TPA: hypothetical protein VMI12_13345 [Puia sp.]|nr:hypothetical protein [Puia sp.]
MLKNCSIWPKEKTSVWMGLYVATYSDEKKNIRKIDISVYGGFFWDENSKSYYEVEDLLKSNWADFWHDSASKFDR